MHLPLLCMVLVGLLIYAGSLDGEFIWDDDALVAGNAHIRSWSNVGAVFANDQGAGFRGDVSYGFYRPVTALTFMLDYRLWGLDPWGYHLSSVLWHILASLGVYLLARRLAGSLAALFCGLLFLAHPVHSEAVSWIACRGELLAAAGIFCAMILYLKALDAGRPAWKFVWASCACVCLAAFSKENALVFPLYILGYHFSFRKKLSWRGFVPFVLFASGYVCLRLCLLKTIMPPDSFAGGETFLRVPGFLRALFMYVRLLFIPVGLHTEYGNRLYPWSDPLVFLGVAIFCALLMYALRSRESQPVVTFGILWFLAALIPVTGMYPFNAFYMAERWLYVPSFGMILAVSCLLARFLHRAALRVVFYAVVALFAGMVSIQVTRWSDPLTFYRWNMRFEPLSARMHNNIGVIYARRHEYRNALAAFEKSVSLSPHDKDHQWNLAIACRLIGEDQRLKSLARTYGFDAPDIPGDIYAKNTLSEFH